MEDNNKMCSETTETKENDNVKLTNEELESVAGGSGAKIISIKPKKIDARRR